MTITSADGTTEPSNPQPTRTDTNTSTLGSNATPSPPPLRQGVEIHSAQTTEDQDLLAKRLTEMGKTYGLGWFIGRDGEMHCGVDQEELKGPYKHKMGDDARMAVMTQPENWDLW
jgi:hypothetical protein